MEQNSRHNSKLCNTRKVYIMAHENFFKIHIPDPCFEDWDKMTSNEQGSFCQVCSKTVVDFSEKSENEIQSFLLGNMDKKVCGRFRISQLETAPIEEPRLKINIEEPKFIFPGFLIPVITPFRATALALMLCASAMVSSCGNSGSSAGDDKPLTGAVEFVPDSVYRPLNNNIDTTAKTIPDVNVMGGLSIKDSKKLYYLSDSSRSCDPLETRTIGKIRITPKTDTLKTDTTETMLKGEIEPRVKMGIILKQKDK